jgi:hypothetical protein
MKNISMQQRIQSSHILWLSLLTSVFLFCVVSTSASATFISEEFSSNSSMVDGSLVSKVDGASPIELSNLNNEFYFLGVVAQDSNSTVTIAKNDANMPVAISGEVNLLASNINGEIKEGDLLTLSWISGVAMKLTENTNTRVIAVALEDFDASSAKSYSSIDSPTGEEGAVKVNQLFVRLTGSDAFSAQQINSQSYGLIEKLTGKEISIVRLIAGLFVFVATFVIASVFIYSSIKGSFISFGRNPLASNAIYAGLLQVSATSVVIIAVGATIAYLIWVV